MSRNRKISNKQPKLPPKRIRKRTNTDQSEQKEREEINFKIYF